MGRPRKLTGTDRVTTRLPRDLIKDLDDWATSEVVPGGTESRGRPGAKLSRNDLIVRELRSSVKAHREAKGKIFPPVREVGQDSLVD